MMSSLTTENTSEMPINTESVLNKLDDIKQKISFVNSLDTTKELVEYCRWKKVKQSLNGVTNKYIKRLLILKYLLGRAVAPDEERLVHWG